MPPRKAANSAKAALKAGLAQLTEASPLQTLGLTAEAAAELGAGSEGLEMAARGLYRAWQFNLHEDRVKPTAATLARQHQIQKAYDSFNADPEQIARGYVNQGRLADLKSQTPKRASVDTGAVRIFDTSVSGSARRTEAHNEGRLRDRITTLYESFLKGESVSHIRRLDGLVRSFSRIDNKSKQTIWLQYADGTVTLQPLLFEGSQPVPKTLEGHLSEDGGVRGILATETELAVTEQRGRHITVTNNGVLEPGWHLLRGIGEASSMQTLVAGGNPKSYSMTIIGGVAAHDARPTLIAYDDVEGRRTLPALSVAKGEGTVTNSQLSPDRFPDRFMVVHPDILIAGKGYLSEGGFTPGALNPVLAERDVVIAYETIPYQSEDGSVSLDPVLKVAVRAVSLGTIHQMVIDYKS